MDRRRFKLPIAVPYPHFMAFAPLDAWIRLLFFPFAFVPPAYWPRMVLGLFTSALGTALTLPERLVLWPVLRLAGARSGSRLGHGPGVVLVLGYYRSGTTHLHYLLSCDPRLRAPTWCETLAPQGFALSWAFLRVFMIPFVSAQRPQDDVAIGPSWPAEDDFALNNWSLCSALPGRFVFPSLHRHYDRFHTLEGLTPAERARWRRTQFAFCWKLARLSGRRALLLKTPSHTARLGELRDLFGPGLKCVHISREPGAVIRSNVSMASRLSLYNLEPPRADDDIQGRITAEYVETERRYLEQARAMAPGTLVEVRYEDLVADPVGQLQEIYRGLGLEWTEEFESRALAYLASVSGYKAASPARGGGDGRGRAGGASDPRVAELAARFGHDRPAASATPLPGGGAVLEPRRGRAATAALGAAVACGILWIAQSYVLRDRHDWLVWPLGVLIGLVSIRVARVGSATLGLWAAGLTLAVLAVIAVPATFLMDYAHRPNYRGLPMRDWEWDHILKATRHGVLAYNNWFWAFMGVVTAYRFASRRHVNPPGTG